MFDHVAIIPSLDDLAVVSEPVQEGGGHLGVAEDLWPLAEVEVCSDYDRGYIIEF